MLPSRRHGLSRTSFLFGAPLISEDPDDALLTLAAQSSLSPDVRDVNTPSPGSGDAPGGGDARSRHRAAGARGRRTARGSREAGLSSDGGGGGDALGLDRDDDGGGEGGQGDGDGELNRQGLDSNGLGGAGGQGLDGDGRGGGNGQGVNANGSAGGGAQGVNAEGGAGGGAQGVNGEGGAGVDGQGVGDDGAAADNDGGGGGGAEGPDGDDVAGVDGRGVGDDGTGADDDGGGDVDGEGPGDDGAGGAAAGGPNMDGPGGAAGGGAENQEPVGAGAENDGGIADRQRRVRQRRLRRRAPLARRHPFSRSELKEWFTFELRALLEIDARVAGQVFESGIEGAGVNDGGVLVLREVGDLIACWGVLSDHRVCVLCSCGGVLGRSPGARTVNAGVEHPELLLAMGVSCSCRHAAALQGAYLSVCRDVGAASNEELFQHFPCLDGGAFVAQAGEDSGGEQGEHDPRGFKVCDFPRKPGLPGVPVYAVFYEGAWAPVAARSRGKRTRIGFCCQLSCASHAWSCIHAKTVSRMLREENSSSSEDESDAGTSSTPETSEAELHEQEQGAGVAADVGAGANAPPPKRRRRARNMFPCRGEVAKCQIMQSSCEVQRLAGAFPRVLPGLYVEDWCLTCGVARGGAHLTQRAAALFTVRGKMIITVADWTCEAGHFVEYDGAEDALFAFEAETVYARVFLDAMLETCVVGRTTMSAAAELWSSTLRNTGAYSDGETGQARQQLSDACGAFSDTLVIPDLAFTCPRCGEEEQETGTLTCVLCDGQVLSVLQDLIVPMLRPGQNCPRAAIPITFACAVRNAVVRAVIRRRVRVGVCTATSVSAKERVQYNRFVAAAEGERPSLPPLPDTDEGEERTREEAEKALLWASSHLFSTFFIIRDAVEEGAGDGAAAGSSTTIDGEAMSELNADSDSASSSSTQDGQEGAENADVAEDLVDGDGFEVMHQLDGLLGDSTRAAEESEVNAEDEELLDALAAARVAGTVSQSVDVPRSMDVVSGGRDGPLPLGAPPSLLVFHGDDEAIPSPAALPAGGAHYVASPRGTPSPTGHPPPNFDTDLEEDPLQFLLSAPQGGTQPEYSSDRWKVPLLLVERVRAGGTPSKSCTVLDPSDPHSPLTLKAMQKTTNVLVGDPATSGQRRSRRHARRHRNGEEVVIQVGPIPIRRMDIMCLLPGEWLTDQAMNGFVEVLKAAFPLPEEGGGADGQKQLYFFGSYFYSVMMNSGYSHDAVRRWTARDDVLSSDMAFVPVNLNQNHWILVVLEWRLGVVTVYDSLGTSPEAGHNVVKWALDEAKAHGHAAKTLVVNDRRAITQENGDDCGVYVCQCMEMLSRGTPLSELKLLSSYYRRRIAAQILCGVL